MRRVILFYFILLLMLSSVNANELVLGTNYNYSATAYNSGIVGYSFPSPNAIYEYGQSFQIEEEGIINITGVTIGLEATPGVTPDDLIISLRKEIEGKDIITTVYSTGKPKFENLHIDFEYAFIMFPHSVTINSSQIYYLVIDLVTQTGGAYYLISQDSDVYSNGTVLIKINEGEWVQNSSIEISANITYTVDSIELPAESGSGRENLFTSVLKAFDSLIIRIRELVGLK